MSRLLKLFNGDSKKGIFEINQADDGDNNITIPQSINEEHEETVTIEPQTTATATETPEIIEESAAIISTELEDENPNPPAIIIEEEIEEENPTTTDEFVNPATVVEVETTKTYIPDYFKPEYFTSIISYGTEKSEKSVSVVSESVVSDYVPVDYSEKKHLTTGIRLYEVQIWLKQRAPKITKTMFWNWVLLILLIIFMGLLIPIIITIFHPLSPKNAHNCVLQNKFKFAFPPGFDNLTRQQCSNQDGCYERRYRKNERTPECYHPFPSTWVYTVVQTQFLNCTDQGEILRIETKPPDMSKFGSFASHLIEAIVYISLKDQNGSLKISVIPSNRDNLNMQNCSKINDKYSPYILGLFKVELGSKGYLDIDVRRNSSDDSIFKFEMGSFAVTENYTEITVFSNSTKATFGLGATNEKSDLNDNQFNKTYLYNNMPNDYGMNNMEGYHPFYVAIENSFESHGVFAASLAPMEVTVQAAPALTYHVLDNKLSFYIFSGPTPTEVIAQFSNLVGKPKMPPYWALGFHTCRVGNRTENDKDMKSMIKYLSDNNVPHETDCLNPEIYRHLDKEKYMEYFKVDLDIAKQNRVSVMLSLVPHIFQDPENFYFPDIPYYKNGNGTMYIGRYFNLSYVAYPDYQNDKISNWLTSNLTNLYKPSNFAGLFLDLNTPLDSRKNCTNATIYTTDFYQSVIDDSLRNNTIGLLNSSYPYSKGSLCMGALDSSGQFHFRQHAAFGYNHMRRVAKVFDELNPGKRNFIQSMSTFSGLDPTDNSSVNTSSHYGGQFSYGDSSWETMRKSLKLMLDYSIYNVPMSGSAICGATGKFDENLCSRWIQLATFYPFAFSYQDLRNNPKDRPIDYENTFIGKVLNISLSLRYSFLPYYYTLLYDSYANGSPVIRPLFLEFPRAVEVYPITRQFMLGPHVMVVPVLEPDSVITFFPQEIWYEFYSGSMNNYLSGGDFSKQSSSIQNLPIYIRSGAIIPMQSDISLSIAETRKDQPFYLLIALSGYQTASGKLYLDDGESELKEKPTCILNFDVVSDRKLLISNNTNPSCKNIDKGLVNTGLGRIKIFGIEGVANHANVTLDVGGNLTTIECTDHDLPDDIIYGLNLKNTATSNICTFDRVYKVLEINIIDKVDMIDSDVSVHWVTSY